MYEYATEPKWANEERTMVDLVVKFDHLPEPVPFTATPTDLSPYGAELFDRAIQGDFGPLEPWGDADG